MESGILPFLKWPGGKRWITPHILSLLNGNNFKRYFEPFLGGGAVFFRLMPFSAILSDINDDLINTYVQVKKRPEDLIRRLQTIPVNKETYLYVRASDSKCKIDRAVRFLYLNRTAFSGLYRLNQKSEFNVPFGDGKRTPEILWKKKLIDNASKALKNASLYTGDFEEYLGEATKGDLVYCDPTYTAVHNNNGFVRYNERNFSWFDQKRLAKAARQAAARGAIVVVSNAFHGEILALYKSAKTVVLNRKSLLCPDKSKRKATKEYLFAFGL